MGFVALDNNRGAGWASGHREWDGAWTRVKVGWVERRDAAIPLDRAQQQQGSRRRWRRSSRTALGVQYACTCRDWVGRTCGPIHTYIVDIDFSLDGGLDGEVVCSCDAAPPCPPENKQDLFPASRGWIQRRLIRIASCTMAYHRTVAGRYTVHMCVLMVPPLSGASRGSCTLRLQALHHQVSWQVIHPHQSRAGLVMCGDHGGGESSSDGMGNRQALPLYILQEPYRNVQLRPSDGRRVGLPAGWRRIRPPRLPAGEAAPTVSVFPGARRRLPGNTHETAFPASAAAAEPAAAVAALESGPSG